MAPIAFGAILLSPRWQDRFSSLTSGVGDTPGGWLRRFGATTALAAQGTHLSQVALLMLVFGLGAGTPLVLAGGVSREVAQRMLGRLMAGGRFGKLALGVVMLLLGVTILADGTRALRPSWSSSRQTG